jgi:Trk K+ transport system NAD-binding subunit/Kef-type K+ transport system membrane component KefB
LEFIAFNTEQIILIIGFFVVAVSANQIAKTFQKIRLPLITGLIFTGIIAGPYIVGLIPSTAKSNLNFINETALAFIAFAAGAELYLRELRSRLNSIKWNTFGQLVVTFVLGTLAVFFMAHKIPYMAEMNVGGKLSVAMITAAIFVARSPASAIAVINELRAKGPFVQTVMGVTVVKDFLVIILFSICLSISQVLISGQEFNFLEILMLLLELGISFVMGFFGYGFILKTILNFRIRRLIKTLLILLTGYSAYYFSSEIGLYTENQLGHKIFLEPLLMCILASFYVTNFSRSRPEFLKILEDVSIPVYVSFFTLTGATLSVNVIGEVIGVALILFGIRIVTMIIGGYTGGLLARDPMKFNHFGWMPYITQAGVALGLATVISNEFPEWGNQFATVIIALIVINQFIGPPLFKWAIFRIGEDRTKAAAESDGIRDATIIGFESQSVALALNLQEHGWDVQLASRKEKGSFSEPEGVKIVYISDLSFEELKSIEADKSEAIVCMLSDDENYQIADLAYQKFGTKDIIVRLNQRNNSQRFLSIGAKIVDPSTAMVNLLDQFVRSPQAASLLLGMEKGKDTRDIELLNPDLHGITLRDLRLPADVIILSVVRGGQTIISHGYTRLRIKDTITAVGSIKSLNQVQLKFDR